MNKAALQGLRELWNSCGGRGGKNDYCLRDNKGRMIIGWINESRAREYQIYYKNSTIEKMPD